jgi:glycosyltransferase involved in cell wall biosynthesis
VELRIKPPRGRRAILVFNCHEAWVHQLGVLDRPLDTIADLHGRRGSGWDSAMRPAPPNARFVSLEQAREEIEPYDCIIAHNLTDLIESKTIHAPRILVLHNTLEHLIEEQQSRTPKEELRIATAQYLQLLGVEAVAVSELKARSWRVTQRVVTCFADAGDYKPYLGDLPCGLRIANDISRKKKTLWWDFHEAAFGNVPVALVGHNDDIAGVRAAENWEELKSMLSHHRFFIHTADRQLEDGYNMATLEAMAAGLPVLGNVHPTSPVEHGKSGFLSNDPAELRGFALLLLKDRELAERLGAHARETVRKNFHAGKFKAGILDAIAAAREKWKSRESAGLFVARP